MIIDDDKMSAVVEYLSEFPHPGAAARGALRRAEIRRDRLFAGLYLRTEGTVKERECKVILDPDYMVLIDGIVGLEEDVENHKARTKSSEMIVEVWRTENANMRAVERVR